MITTLLLWLVFYASFTLFTPALLDDADSVHVEVAREMLLRHDWGTLYANGIRYLEKAPLLYWSMAASMKLFSLFGATSPQSFVAAARLPLAFTVLALAFAVESLARRIFRSTCAGLYATLILLSSFGIFIFTRITIPDAMVCLWITVAIASFWRTEEETTPSARHCWIFAAACALNVLTKGLIGIVFPIGIVLVYLLLSRGVRGAIQHLTQLHLLSSALIFLAIAAPWHVLVALQNPTQGHPAPITFTNGHWQVPLPTDGNVHGWLWFYFMNEHLLRYLNLRVPHDYDTSRLWLFWGLCFVWLMPWSAYLFHATVRTVKRPLLLRGAVGDSATNSRLLLLIWAALPLLFFSLSTRQEYYVLPALPALILLITLWLDLETREKQGSDPVSRANRGIAALLVTLGSTAAVLCLFFVIQSGPRPVNFDLADILNQNPGDYALSMGHFLDLTGPAMRFFRIPLILAAFAFFAGPLANLLLRRRNQTHAANLSLAAAAFVFLLAADLGLQTFSPVLSSAQLAQAIAPQVHADDLIVIHGEYEAGSTLGFYLGRPNGFASAPPQYTQGFGTGPHLTALNPIGIHEGRSSNLWYGSFFPDAPPIFMSEEALAQAWSGPRRVFMWQSLTDAPNKLPALPGPVYILVKNGGKEIVSNQPTR